MIKHINYWKPVAKAKDSAMLQVTGLHADAGDFDRQSRIYLVGSKPEVVKLLRARDALPLLSEASGESEINPRKKNSLFGQNASMISPSTAGWQ